MNGGSLAIGVAAALAAALTSAAAVALQASEARRDPEERVAHLALIRQLVRRPRWVGGVLLLAVSWGLQLTALGFAPLTVVQPLLSTTLVVLLVIGRLWLHEPVGRRAIVSVVAIAAGLAIVEFAAPGNQLDHPRTVPLVISVAVITAGVVIATSIGRSSGRASLLLIAAAGVGYGGSDFTAKLLSNGVATDHWIAVVGWCVACVGFGVVSLVNETFVLQSRAATVVAPVIAAMKSPIPVVLALWVGGTGWGPGDGSVVIAGLALVAFGAARISKARAVVAATAHERRQGVRARSVSAAGRATAS